MEEGVRRVKPETVTLIGTIVSPIAGIAGVAAIVDPPSEGVDVDRDSSEPSRTSQAMTGARRQ